MLGNRSGRAQYACTDGVADYDRETEAYTQNS